MGYIKVAGDWEGFIPKADVPVLHEPADLVEYLGSLENDTYVEDIEVGDAGDRWDVIVHLKGYVDMWASNYSPGDYWNPPEYDVEYGDIEGAEEEMRTWFPSAWEMTSWEFWETDDYDLDLDGEDW